jgi:hypothetical protein
MDLAVGRYDGAFEEVQERRTQQTRIGVCRGDKDPAKATSRREWRHVAEDRDAPEQESLHGTILCWVKKGLSFTEEPVSQPRVNRSDFRKQVTGIS